MQRMDKGRAFVIVLLSLAALGAVAYGGARFTHARRWQTAYVETQAKFARAWDARDQPGVYYREHFDDLWAADRNLENVRAWGAKEEQQSSKIKRCIDLLEEYRTAAESGSGSNRFSASDADYMQQAAAGVPSCLVE